MATWKYMTPKEIKEWKLLKLKKDLRNVKLKTLEIKREIRRLEKDLSD